MKYVLLIVRNLGRNRRRAGLAIASLAVPFFLLTALQTALDSMDQLVGRTVASPRLVVFNRMGLLFDIPLKPAAELARVPGVVAVCSADGFIGTFRSPRDVLPVTAIEIEPFKRVWHEWRLGEEHDRAFRSDRTGCVMDRKLAGRLGLTVGERLVIRGTVVPIDLELTLRGLLDGWLDPYGFFMHRSYLETVLRKEGYTTDFWLLVDRVQSVPAIRSEVQALFASSGWDVTVEEEKAFFATFLSMAGNVQKLVAAVGAMVVVLVLLIASNFIAMSVRERTSEIALMKALGFPGRTILALVLAEAGLLGLVGGFLGCWGGYAAFGNQAVQELTREYSVLFRTPGPAALLWSLLAPVVGMLAGLVPAVRAARRSVVDGLRKVA
ncbi:MAG: ABC transporter permease [Candidatus Riflebacteria bacterium]|nr:ABC transporter permease [Candidatus Riflebacteria bacterium]